MTLSPVQWNICVLPHASMLWPLPSIVILSMSNSIPYLYVKSSSSSKAISKSKTISLPPLWIKSSRYLKLLVFDMSLGSLLLKMQSSILLLSQVRIAPAYFARLSMNVELNTFKSPLSYIAPPLLVLAVFLLKEESDISEILQLYTAPPLIWAVLLLKLESDIFNSPLLCSAPPSLCAAFQLKVELDIFNSPLLCSAPPSHSCATFSLKLDSIIFNSPLLSIAPPLSWAEFLLKSDSIIFNSPLLSIAPPTISSAILLLKVELDIFNFL